MRLKFYVNFYENRSYALVGVGRIYRVFEEGCPQELRGYFSSSRYLVLYNYH